MILDNLQYTHVALGSSPRGFHPCSIIKDVTRMMCNGEDWIAVDVVPVDHGIVSVKWIRVIDWSKIQPIKLFESKIT